MLYPPELRARVINDLWRFRLPSERESSSFTQKRKYLLGVTPKTIIRYGCGFKAFEAATESRGSGSRRIVELRDRKVQPITINGYLSVLNAFFKWNNQAIKIPRLKEEQKILQALTPDHINRLVHYEPAGRNQLTQMMKLERMSLRCRNDRLLR